MVGRVAVRQRIRLALNLTPDVLRGRRVVRQSLCLLCLRMPRRLHQTRHGRCVGLAFERSGDLSGAFRTHVDWREIVEFDGNLRGLWKPPNGPIGDRNQRIFAHYPHPATNF